MYSPPLFIEGCPQGGGVKNSFAYLSHRQRESIISPLTGLCLCGRNIGLTLLFPLPTCCIAVLQCGAALPLFKFLY